MTASSSRTNPIFLSGEERGHSNFNNVQTIAHNALGKQVRPFALSNFALKCSFALVVHPDNKCAMKPRRRASPSPFMTVGDLARYLKVSYRTIYRLRRNGQLPFLKLGSGFRFHRLEINKWIAEQQLKYADALTRKWVRKRHHQFRRDE